MNKNLRAMQYKLILNLEALLREKTAIIDDLVKLNKNIDKKRASINNSAQFSVQIIPELEIAKMNFFIRTQDELNQLESNLSGKNQELARLNTMEIQINIELKLIDNYACKLRQGEQQVQQSRQDKQLDEWVIQRGLSHAN